jgi:hypothetical protein
MHRKRLMMYGWHRARYAVGATPGRQLPSARVRGAPRRAGEFDLLAFV